MVGTELYHRTITFDYGDQKRADLMRKVWSVTPWMIDCFTDSINSDREGSIRHWCSEHIGPQAHPIHGREGDWQLGGATIHGWTWIGFASEQLLEQFLAAFPQPERVP